MLPEIKLREVSRADVDRVASWLADEDVSSRWFGSYACGDPVHRAYVPQIMLEASQSEWSRIFSNGSRVVLSTYTNEGLHVGEGEIILDDQSGAEISVLIGRKDLWRQGYGTAVVLALLDRIFDGMGLDKAWASVPDDNAPALGLFRKLGFVVESKRDLCGHAAGTQSTASIMTMKAIEYRARREHQPERRWVPIATVTGLPGSGSREIAQDIARRIGSRFVDEEISAELCKRLRCSLGELEALENSFRSRWSRWLRRMAVPMHWSAGGEPGFEIYAASSRYDYYKPAESITKSQYLKALGGVVRKMAARGNAVLHGHGAHLLVPEAARSISVFVAAPREWRARNVASVEDMTRDEASRWLRRADRDSFAVYRNLFDVDIENSRLYDLSINPERVSIGMAVQTVAGALGVSIEGEAVTPLRTRAPVTT